MPTLHITQLHCIKKRDPIGKDEIDIYVTIDGAPQEFLSGPFFLDKSKNDDTVTFHQDRNFDEEIKVRLMERDGDRGGTNDRDLGETSFDTSEIPDHKRTFEDGGVAYSLTCRVTS